MNKAFAVTDEANGKSWETQGKAEY